MNNHVLNQYKYEALQVLLPNNYLTDYEFKTFRPMFFHFDKNKSCVAMLLSNLAHAEWIHIPCKKPALVNHVFCLIEEYDHNQTMSLHSDNITLYDASCVMVEKTCHLVIWTSKEKEPFKDISFNIRLFQVLFNAVDVIFPPIFSYNFSYIFKYQIYSNYYHYKKEINYKNTTEGLYFNPKSAKKFKIGGNIFKCDSGIYISYYFVCDGEIDCSAKEKTDENSCLCNRTQKYSTKCKYLIEKSISGKDCGAFYYKSYDGSCTMFTFFESVQSHNYLLPSNSSGFFSCDDGTLISNVLVNDLVADCGPKGEDEEVLNTIYANDISNQCHMKYQIPCGKGHVRCYNVSEICTFKLNEMNVLHPCRTGEHLQNCVQFECNMMFKCPHYYCVPWSYVCDGKWDCPGGTDELGICHEERVCKNMFKCRISHMCIHLGDICNDQFDCPERDDENMCSLSNQICPLGCQCLTFAIRCFNITSFRFDLQKHLPYYILNINLSSQEFVENILNNTKILISLFISTKHKLSLICAILPPLTETIYLHFTQNKIFRITSYCFSNSARLKLIKLNGNMISYINHKAFNNLSSLNYINLQNNSLLDFDLFILAECPHFKWLSLHQNVFMQIVEKSLKNIKLEIVLSDDYRICCVLGSNVKCSTSPPWYKSCSTLLPTMAFKLSFYFLSSVIILVNLASIVLQKVSLKTGCENTAAFGISVASVNISDLLCGVYITIIWISDFVHSGTFVLKEISWLSSIPCFIIFGTSLYFNILSPLLLSYMSFSRLMVVMSPLDSKFKESKFNLHCVFSLFCWTLVLTTGITITVWTLYNNVPFSLCSPFVDPSN